MRKTFYKPWDGPKAEKYNDKMRRDEVENPTGGSRVIKLQLRHGGATSEQIHYAFTLRIPET